MLHIFIYAYTYTWTSSLEIIQAPYLLVDSDFKIHIHTFSELLQCYWYPVNFQQSSLVWTYSQCINLTAHEEKNQTTMLSPKWDIYITTLLPSLSNHGALGPGEILRAIDGR